MKKYFKQQGDEIAITQKGMDLVERFKIENPELYALINFYTILNLWEMMEEELDEKDFKRIKKAIAWGT